MLVACAVHCRKCEVVSGRTQFLLFVRFIVDNVSVKLCVVAGLVHVNTRCLPSLASQLTPTAVGNYQAA